MVHNMRQRLLALCTCSGVSVPLCPRPMASHGQHLQLFAPRLPLAAGSKFTQGSALHQGQTGARGYIPGSFSLLVEQLKGVLYGLLEGLSSVGQSDNRLIAHPLLASLPSLSHVPTPIDMFPGVPTLIRQKYTSCLQVRTRIKSLSPLRTNLGIFYMTLSLSLKKNIL